LVCGEIVDREAELQRLAQADRHIRFIRQRRTVELADTSTRRGVNLKGLRIEGGAQMHAPDALVQARSPIQTFLRQTFRFGDCGPRTSEKTFGFVRCVCHARKN